MDRDAVFLDTAGLVGVFVPSDGLHARACDILDDLAMLGTPLISSDWVMMEFLNATSAPVTRTPAARYVRQLMESRGVTVVPAEREGLLGRLKLYESRPDKEWGIVDCSSMLICRDRGIKRVFTRDLHFRQAGFEILL